MRKAHAASGLLSGLALVKPIVSGVPAPARQRCGAQGEGGPGGRGARGSRSAPPRCAGPP